MERPEAAAQGCDRWWIGGEEYAVEATKAHSGSLLAKLAGVANPEAARKLKGARVEVERAGLPDPGAGHYYLGDLVGLAVVNEQGEALGEVARFFTNGAQDVMVLAGSRERMLPWVPAVVKEVDLAARRIVVEWGADW